VTTITTEPLNQRGLIAAAQAGDERAFRELVGRYERALQLHCYRMLGSLHDAQDLTQETLLRAWRSLERFERRSGVQTWLYRIATNACLDELERRPRRPEPTVDPYPDAWLPDDGSAVDPAARYARREGIELAFLTAIQRLPGRQRAVLILRDVLGWTGAETAALLDTTVAAANSALQRARATIDGALPAQRVAPGPMVERALLARYVDAFERTDIAALVAILREDAELTMPPQPAVVGALAVAEWVCGGCGAVPGVVVATWVSANGGPAILWRVATPDGPGAPQRLIVPEADGDRFAALHTFAARNLPGFGAS
jgi:RNA polymerase sigma-70 factor (ECF subfamily)